MSARSPRRARASGLKAEALVESILVTRGYLPIARNHVCRGGEVDLVMGLGELVVFVEVKRRRRGRLSEGLESVTVTKQRRVVRAAADFLLRAGLGERPVRFDVVAVAPSARSPQLLHVEGAFDASAGGEHPGY